MIQTISEGWADYIGNTYAAIKYGNTNIWEGTSNTENTAWLYNATAPYATHLENNPTYFNDFIPRGLFYDLTDGPDAENFDEIQGFTTNDIYQKLNPTMTTIQQFRARWEMDHPNVNNALLFDEYEID